MLGATRPFGMTSEGFDSLYALLGVPATATTAEIKKAYRSLALKHHPDRVKEEQEKRRAAKQFKLIHDAYAVLSDPAARRKYDAELAAQSSRARQGRGSRGGGRSARESRTWRERARGWPYSSEDEEEGYYW